MKMKIPKIEKCLMFPSELKLFLQDLIDLKNQMIDFDNLEVEIAEKYETITIRSKSNRYCPISFIIWDNGGKKIFQFCYGANGAVLEEEFAKFQSDLQSFQSYLLKYLSTTVEEHLTYSEGRLIKGKYFYYFDFGKQTVKTSYTGYQKFMIWPWQSRTKEIHKYEPWLQQQDIPVINQLLEQIPSKRGNR
jgi:hypothetical protein